MPKNNPLIKEYDINVREPDNNLRFFYNFNFKTRQKAKDISFRTFKKLLREKKFRKIVIDQIIMLEYNVFLLFAMDKVLTSGYR